MEKQLVYRYVQSEDLTRGALAHFVRRQQVTECWRHTESGLRLLPIAFVDDWSEETRAQRVNRLLALLAHGGAMYAAFDGADIVGYIALGQKSPDCPADTVEVVAFHVSEPMRHQGIGKRLFAEAVMEGRRRGARRLYISAHSAKESQAAYQRLGCVETGDPLASAVAAEPCDIQMEYRL